MKYIQQLRNFIFDKHKKPYQQIFREVAFLWVAFGSFPLHYFTRYAYRVDSGDFRDYLHIGLVKEIWASETLHDRACCSLLNNKEDFFRFVYANGIRTPIVICSNIENRFKFDSRDIYLNTEQEFRDFIVNLDRDLFVKPITGKQGRDCFKILFDDLHLYDLSKIWNVIKNGSFIFQELIIQHPIISELNPFSINTLRIDTYKDNLGEIHILTPFIRLGTNKNITDNTSTAGFIVPVDLSKGLLGSQGIQYLSVSTELLSKHPETGIIFKDVSLPFSEEIVSLVKRIGGLVSDRLVGWDVAIGVDGPMIIEGNCDYAMAGQDIIVKGYKSHPIFRRMLIEHNLL